MMITQRERDQLIMYIALRDLKRPVPISLYKRVKFIERRAASKGCKNRGKKDNAGSL